MKRPGRKPTGTGLRMADASWFSRRPEWVGDVEARFASKIAKTSPSECWLWMGALTHEGYGRFSVTLSDGHEYAVSAHRFALALHLGRMPIMSACHRCDVPACVNAEHLFEATHVDNIADKMAKGRQSRGEQHGRSRLSDADIRHILTMKGAKTAATLAAEHGVSEHTIYKYWSAASAAVLARRFGQIPAQESA